MMDPKIATIRAYRERVLDAINKHIDALEPLYYAAGRDDRATFAAMIRTSKSIRRQVELVPLAVKTPSKRLEKTIAELAAKRADEEAGDH